MPDWRWLRQVRLRLRTLFRRNRLERELDDEFQFHIEQRIELEIARGLSAKDARFAALRAMDGMAQRKEECRDVRRANHIDDVMRNFQYAARNLRRRPAVAMLVMCTLALGVGSTTAVFGVVDGLLINPLTYPEARSVFSSIAVGPYAVCATTLPPAP